MKHLLFLFFIVLFSANSFALPPQLKKAEGENIKPEVPGKSKKPTSNAAVKDQRSPNQRVKTDTTETKEFYGPLSWRPALLY